ncbi:MAG: hypothetical protein JNL98_19830 [Bryobacterales bacterium]|nr:hypothetical protein [Bryobacterales bacterium]
MKYTVELTAQELNLLANLASDQLFRREFIDPKMPGHRSNVAEVALGKDLVERLRLILNPDRARRTTRPAAAK